MQYNVTIIYVVYYNIDNTNIMYVNNIKIMNFTYEENKAKELIKEWK